TRGSAVAEVARLAAAAHAVEGATAICATASAVAAVVTARVGATAAELLRSSARDVALPRFGSPAVRGARGRAGALSLGARVSAARVAVSHALAVLGAVLPVGVVDVGMVDAVVVVHVDDYAARVPHGARPGASADDDADGESEPETSCRIGRRGRIVV